VGNIRFTPSTLGRLMGRSQREMESRAETHSSNACEVLSYNAKRCLPVVDSCIPSAADDWKLPPSSAFTQAALFLRLQSDPGLACRETTAALVFGARALCLGLAAVLVWVNVVGQLLTTVETISLQFPGGLWLLQRQRSRCW